MQFKSSFLKYLLNSTLIFVGLTTLVVSPAHAAYKVQLPGENLSAPVVDNPIATNNGEGHDLDDIEELREHWVRPEYLVDQHRQIFGFAIFGGIVAILGTVKRQRLAR
jgi:hypothetical protein